MVFQEPRTALDPLMKVGRQVGEPLRIHEGLSRRAADKRAQELLSRVALTNPRAKARAYPHELSGGQRQRVMIAMALACSPRLLIADEPTTALDALVQAQIIELIREQVDESGTALLLISHDMSVVASMCERLVVMYGGQIIESGPTKSLCSRPAHPYTAALLEVSKAMSTLEARLGAPSPRFRETDDFVKPDTEHSSSLRVTAALQQSRLPVIQGEQPGRETLINGCVFARRCEHADSRCAEKPPYSIVEAKGARSSHQVACWHPLQAKREAVLPSPVDQGRTT